MKKISNDTSRQASTAVEWHEIDADIAGQRVDNYLLARLKGVPRSLVYRILRKGEVRVNKGRVKPDYKLRTGDILRVPPIRTARPVLPPRLSESLVQRLHESVVFEDDSLLIINKPSGLAVHGGSGVSLGLIESLRQIRPQDTFLELVHRLDRDTSGCVMIAKNRRLLRLVQKQLRDGAIDKVYLALVGGRWPNRRKEVNVTLLKNQLASGERIVKVVEAGTARAKTSRTRYQVVERYSAGCTLVETRPITGRTHQIRVHSQYAGFPILGDEKYGNREQNLQFRNLGLNRLFLHAWRLKFIGMNDKTIQVEAPLAEELQCLLDNLSVTTRMKN